HFERQMFNDKAPFVYRNNNINGLQWQTHLTARIGAKGQFLKLANLIVHRPAARASGMEAMTDDDGFFHFNRPRAYVPNRKMRHHASSPVACMYRAPHSRPHKRAGS